MEMVTAEEWARQQWQGVDVGDRRLTQRAVQIGQRMAQNPEASIPQQMGKPSVLEAAYRLLNNPRVTMEGLLRPHFQNTLAQARKEAVVLWVEDTTELDYTRHRRSKKGMSIIGDGHGYGVLLHSTLAVEPTKSQVLGLGDVQTVLRQPREKGKKKKWRETPEGEVWRESAEDIGAAPEGTLWVHIADREADNFAFMATCVELNKHFVVRAQRNRRCKVGEKGEEVGYVMDYARQLRAEEGHTLTLSIPARHGKPAREAHLQVAWGTVILEPPAQAPRRIRAHAPYRVWVVRVWEPEPPSGEEGIEWVLLTSLPVTSFEEAQEKAQWYRFRWLCEDYHQCLKTGCCIEQRQLDDYEDIRRLLGFLAPIAVRLLQLRQIMRQDADGLACQYVDPWMVRTLARLTGQDENSMTIQEFWSQVARLGGFLGRKGDGQPGWRTLWRGWKYLTDLTQGARLFLDADGHLLKAHL